jgi:RNA polymerase sigma-70 factor (ECF subfamily)
MIQLSIANYQFQMTRNDDQNLNETIDHLFRRHSGQMVAVLCRRFGFVAIDTVEDAVQDALIAAMKTWPYSGVPENQFAWLLRAAKNRCIDILRRENRSTSIDADEGFDIATSDDEFSNTSFADELGEEQLQMIFACCHPEISPDSRVALTLKTVGGFSTGEIAHAFLAKAEAVSKLITRARSRLRESGVRMEIPSPDELTERIDSVLKTLYLMFNEGYSASSGEALIRKDLVFEAIRLVTLLASHPVTSLPTVDALAALFCFQAARMPQRAGHNGELLILAEQDREAWDQRLIARGLNHFRLSASGDSVSDYHLEAQIAAVYTLARDYFSTDWRQILDCYEQLQSRRFSPVRELNRIIVIGELDGPAVAYSRLIELNGELDNYSLFFITKAHYEKMLGETSLASESLNRALQLSNNDLAKRFVEKKLLEITN